MKACAVAGLVLALLAPLAGRAEAQTFTPRAPAEGEEIHSERPTLAFDVQLPLGFDRSRIRFVLDGDDLTEFARWRSADVRVIPPLPLADGEHVAEVRRWGAEGAEETLAKVTFRAVPPRRRTALALELRDAPSLGLASEGAGSLALAPHASGVWSGAAGAASLDATWAPSGPLEGPRPGLPEPEGVLQVERGGLQVRAGVIRGAGGQNLAAPEEEPQLSAIRSPRRALDARWDDASWGRVTLFGDLLDPAITGVGAVPRQRVAALGWRLPSLFGQRLDLQLSSLRARRETGDGSSTGPVCALSPETGELNAFLLAFRPGGAASGWSLVTEGAFSRGAERQQGQQGPALERGSAFRLNAAGTLAGQSLTLRLSRVDAAFSNPADLGLARGRDEGGLELSRYASRWDYRLSANRSRDRGPSSAGAESREGRLHLGWRPFAGTDLLLEGSRQEVTSPFTDLAHTDFRLSLSRRRGLWAVDLGGSGGLTTLGPVVQRDRFVEGTLRRDEAGRWGLTAGLSAAEQRVGATAPPTRLASLLLAPVWKPGDRLRLTLRLQATASDFSAPSFDDGTLAAQGSATWTLPQRWQSLSLTAQAGWQRSPLGTERRADLSLSLVPLWRSRR